jgi:hypothetical protein
MAETMSTVKGKPQCDISGCDNNMFYILVYVRKALIANGRAKDIATLETKLDAAQKNKQDDYRIAMLNVIGQFVTLVGGRE